MSFPNLASGGAGSQPSALSSNTSQFLTPTPFATSTSGMSDQEAAIVRNMQIAMESCVGKTLMSGVMGFALGGAFGIFMSSMSYDSSLTPASRAIADLPLKQQIKTGLRDMGTRSLSSARNFGIVGAVFAGSECCIEGFRARNDAKNGVAAGCVTGALLAAKAGPQAAGLGCAGFAAFSAAIEWYLRMPATE